MEEHDISTQQAPTRIRVIDFEEPTNAETINGTFIKTLTGGDRFACRQLYPPIQPTPRFRMILTCNRLPYLDGDDNTIPYRSDNEDADEMQEP